MPTASDLARACREERLDFNEAIVRHLEENLGLEPDLCLVLAITLAVGFANLSQCEKLIDLPDGRTFTAQEIINQFGIAPFLEQPQD